VADKYEVDGGKRFVNRVMAWMARRGIGPAVLLTTTGRRSGEPRTLPVSPVIVDAGEYLVAPYGAVGWVVNARANPDALLRRGRDERAVRLSEVIGGTARVLAAYYESQRFPRRYMNLPADPTIDDFNDKASLFPVFMVEDRSA
jgi:deazaflavin-dependent oxidoreductase (nitroreductase family)